MEQNKKKIQQINIELDSEISSGEYANFVVTTHSPAEFVLDFTRILPGVPVDDGPLGQSTSRQGFACAIRRGSRRSRHPGATYSGSLRASFRGELRKLSSN